MSRSKWKGPFVDVSVLKLKKKLTAKSKKVWSRSSQIPSFLLGKQFPFIMVKSLNLFW